MTDSSAARDSLSNFQVVRVYTLSEELFKNVSELGRVAPYQFHWKTVMEMGAVSKGLILVDTGTMEIDIAGEMKEGLLLFGKGEDLLRRWKDFLDQTFSVECSPEGFEEFLRWRIRPVLERSCEWPGGVFNFFQEILSSVLISEALLLTGGNRQKTAQILGISRNTLRNRMQDKEVIKK